MTITSLSFSLFWRLWNAASTSQKNGFLCWWEGTRESSRSCCHCLWRELWVCVRHAFVTLRSDLMFLRKPKRRACECVFESRGNVCTARATHNHIVSDFVILCRHSTGMGARWLRGHSLKVMNLSVLNERSFQAGDAATCRSAAVVYFHSTSSK